MQSPTRTRIYYGILWLIAIFFFLRCSGSCWLAQDAQRYPGHAAQVCVYADARSDQQDTLRHAGQGISNTIPYFVNSLVLSIGSVLIAIVVSFLAAYAFSRYKPRPRTFLMFLLL